MMLPLLSLAPVSLMMLLFLLLLASMLSDSPFSEGSLKSPDSFSLVLLVVLLLPMTLSFLPSLLTLFIPSALLMKAVPFVEGSLESLESLAFVLSMVLLSSSLLLLQFSSLPLISLSLWSWWVIYLSMRSGLVLFWHWFAAARFLEAIEARLFLDLSLLNFQLIRKLSFRIDSSSLDSWCPSRSMYQAGSLSLPPPLFFFAIDNHQLASSLVLRWQG